MIPCSQLLKDASIYSQTVGLTVDIMRGSEIVAPKIPVIDGGLSADRGSKTRMFCDITIADPGIDLGVDVHRFRVRRGYQSLGVAESIQHGIFRVDDISEEDTGTWTINGSGLESYIIDARFLQPRTPPYGVSTIGQIRDLIQEVLPNAVVVAECSRDKIVQATAPWDTERWDAIDALARSIDAEVFADWRGYFVIRDIPSLSNSVPVFQFKTGPDGTLRTRTPKRTRDRVYNAVSVSGQSSDPNVPPVWGWAYDDDPTSPTYYYGDFGQVPRFYTSQFFTTSQQCTDYARRLLQESLAANRALSLTALPVTFLEVGDVIEVVLASGEVDRRILQKMDFGLGYNTEVAIDTLLLKDLSDDEV
jgi:hypothetical protein